MVTKMFGFAGLCVAAGIPACVKEEVTIATDRFEEILTYDDSLLTRF